MQLTWDETKRKLTLEHRGLDFADAAKVFRGRVTQAVDDRRDYGKTRYVSVGDLDGVIVVIVWTLRDSGRRIIAMWKANGPDRNRYRSEMD